MSKWADYGISAVQYNTEHKHIVKLRIHEDKGDTIGAPTDYTRQSVIDAIHNGTTFVTIIKDTSGKWNKGQSVYIIKISGTEYVKTKDNGKESDNLENLPEF